LAQYLPSDWTPLTLPDSSSAFQSLSIDGDADNEWLLFYRYDSPEGATSGPIGGIIYNVQQNADPYDPDVVIPFPFQPMAFFVPYRLLPDWTPGKGQGYLGETTVTWELTKLTQRQEPADELLVQGTSPSNAVTRVSIFRWNGETEGYSVAFFFGSHSAAIEAGREAGDAVRQVVTSNALDDRSDLCERTVWTRQGDTLSFAASPPAIVFCLGSAPAQPMYPEAVVLAYLLTGNTELVLPGSLAQVQSVVRSPVARVVTLAYPGTATVTGTGASAVSQMVVQTLSEGDQGQSRVEWLLEEQRSNAEEKTTRWRIVSAKSG
jgi:hypothetical protein